MQVQLIVTNKSNHGQVIPVNVPAFRIGQAEDCHLRSQSSQISQQHCVIYIHEGTVTIQDLGGKTGTIVNDKRITSTVTLKDGDQLAVGRHSFTLSIKSETAPLATSQSEVFDLAHSPKPEPEPEPEPEAEIMFEVRHKGQNVSVTQARLFEMALKGLVLPDDIIIVAGTKVFADSVRGIVFGKESSDAPSHSYASPASNATYAPAQSDGVRTAPAAPVFHGSAGPPVEENSPFDIDKEPVVQIDRVPGAKKDMTFSDLGKSLEKPLTQASSWMGGKITSQHVLGGGFGLIVLCLLGLLVYWLMPEEKSLYGAVRIAGTLTLNGEPVDDVAVTFHSRAGEEFKAIGKTDKRGRFTVRTGADPPGRGAVPGEYDVSFRKKEVIPSEYENPQTLINRGLAPITVAPSGNKPFIFELTSNATPSRPATERSPGSSSSPQTTGTQPGTTSVPPAPVPTPQVQPPPDNTGEHVQQVPEPAESGSQPPRPPEPPAPPPPPRFSDVFKAATEGTARDVRTFVEQNHIDVTQKDSNGNTPLHLAAAANSDVAVVRYLISLNAEVVNAKNNDGDTPIHNAARSNPNTNVLGVLIAAPGAVVNAKNNNGDLPLDVADTRQKSTMLYNAVTRGQ